MNGSARSLPDPAAASRAVAYMIVGAMLLTSQDAITKWLLQWHGVGEVMFWRGLLSLPMIGALVWFEGGRDLLRSRNPKVNLLRAFFALLTSVLVVVSFHFMPLADALAVIFVNPLLLTALSIPLLGEKVGWRRWLAVGFGFAGVLAITRPGFEGGAGLAVLIPLSAALFAALRDITTRKLGGQDSATTVMLYTMLVATVGGALSLPFEASWPSGTSLAWLVFAALLLTASHWFTIGALHLAEAGLVAPFKYLSLVWAAVLGFLVWDDVPDLWKVAGAALIVASSLYTAHREARRRI